MKSREKEMENLSTNKTITTKINPTPTCVHTQLIDQVEDLANINQKIKTPQNQPQTVSEENTSQQPPKRERRDYQQVTHKRKLMRKRGK